MYVEDQQGLGTKIKTIFLEENRRLGYALVHWIPAKRWEFADDYLPSSLPGKRIIVSIPVEMDDGHGESFVCYWFSIPAREVSCKGGIRHGLDVNLMK